MTITHHIATAAVNGDIPLAPYSLPPGGVLADDPNPRIWSTTCEDGHGSWVMSGVLAADVGTIRNRVQAVETIHVLEGRVRIELDSGEAVELGPGDIAVLPRGPVATWTFIEPFKELFVVSGVTE